MENKFRVSFTFAKNPVAHEVWESEVKVSSLILTISGDDINHKDAVYDATNFVQNMTNLEIDSLNVYKA
jgi:hypothetical protein